jgi:hypothetical protein
MLSAGGLRGKYSKVRSPASPLSGLPKARGRPVMRATGRGFDCYHAVSAVWIPPGRRRTRDGMVAWDKRLRTIPASLYAETATRKMRTPWV